MGITKRLFLISVISLAALQCSLGQVTFQKTYDSTGFAGKNVIETYDMGYVTSGTFFNNFGADGNIYVVKTNVYGDVAWANNYIGPYNIFSTAMSQTADSGFIIAGHFDDSLFNINTCIFKLDSLGNVQWARSYLNATLSFVNDIKQTPDGGFIMAGYTQVSIIGDVDVNLIKTDAMGIVQWSKTYGGEVGYSVLQTPDGGYLAVAAGESVSGSANYTTYLVKTDSAGNPQWTKTFAGLNDMLAFSFCLAPGGGYLLAGYYTKNLSANDCDAMLIKTDSTGNIIWSKLYGGTDLDYAFSVCNTNDGGFAFAGHTHSFGGGSVDVYFVKVNSAGDTVFTKTIGTPDYEVCSAIAQASDGGFILSARFSGSAPTQCLIKSDSTGNTGCNKYNTLTALNNVNVTVIDSLIMPVAAATVSSPITIIATSAGNANTLCTSVGMHSLIQDAYFSISPNPTNGNFTITFPSTINKGTVEVYNTIGAKLYSQNIINTNTANIQLNNLAQGIYFVKVLDDNKDYCKKIIIE